METAPPPFRTLIERPIFIVSSPRSGSTLLFETLAQAPGLYSPGGESHGIIEGVPALSVPSHGFASNRLTAEDATPETAEALARAFYASLRDRDSRPAGGTVRMLEKTPKNALRVPFFDRVWPDSTFVFLYRDARQTMASMIEAWVSGRFRTYPGLPGWNGHPWSLLLVPGWQQLDGQPLAEVVANQWATTIDTLIDDLSALPHSRLRALDYRQFLAAPQATIEPLAASLDLAWDRQLGPRLPLSKTTLSTPSQDKWRAIAPAIEEVWPIVAPADARAKDFVAGLTD